jgi:hypothetical protein
MAKKPMELQVGKIYILEVNGAEVHATYRGYEDIVTPPDYNNTKGVYIFDTIEQGELKIPTEILATYKPVLWAGNPR